MLILKAISLGPLHGYGVLLRIQQISKNRLESSKALSTLHCTGWNIKDGSQARGARRRTIVRPSITA